MSPGESYAILLQVFRDLGIQWFIGGSIASSFHSIPRASLDVDIIASVRPDQAEALERSLKNDFYADAEMIRQAILAGRAFNLIHTATSYKFDIFPLQSDEFHQIQLSRRIRVDLADAGLPGQDSYIASLEDILLEKLNWYRQGGSVSERQWNDIISLIQVQQQVLDYAYLDHWAPTLGVTDLLARAQTEAISGSAKPAPHASPPPENP